jgi:ATP-dependent helicase/nuclease subunit A
MADKTDPHAFFARILASKDGRRAFLTRLGPEALDVLDEFMAETLRYEESNTPSLEGFLDWLQGSDTEIKRDSDTLRDEVRVMTVHGAKGLEADIVFLVDNGMSPTVAAHDPRLLPLDEADDPDNPGPLVWNRSIKVMPGLVRDRIQGWRTKSEEEYRRLLYVAMTRARDRLYVVGIDKRTPANDGRWHAIVRRALDAECTETTDASGAVSLEWRATSRVPVGPVVPEAAIRSPPLPEWALRPLAAAPPGLRLAPSSVPVADAGEPVTPSFHGSADARERGRIVHRLLQSLPDVPPADRDAVGRRYLAAAANRLDRELHAPLLTEVMAILDDERFAAVFAPGSRAEIDIVGVVQTARGPATVAGRIDRLAVTASRVLIVDYKTNRPAPARLADVPAAYVAQLALYRHVLGRLYAGRIVEAALLWTDARTLMAIPPDVLDAAETAILGGARGGPP